MQHTVRYTVVPNVEHDCQMLLVAALHHRAVSLAKGLLLEALALFLRQQSSNTKWRTMLAEKSVLRLMQLADRYLMPECVECCAAALTPTVGPVLLSA